MKTALAAAAALVLLSAVAAVSQETKTPAPKPAPTRGAGVSVKAGAEAPKGGQAVEPQDLRALAGNPDDPFQLERLGVGAAQANELGRARTFFESAWKLGQLPTAAFNLACIDVREKRLDAAWAELDRAIAAGFDDDLSLAKDPDLAPLRDQARFRTVLEGAKRNRAAGDAAVVKEGIFLAPKGAAVAVLVLLHDAGSSPMTVAAPFVADAGRRGLFLAVPRGPGKSATKRFGWGSAERAAAAVEAAIAEARKRTGRAGLPVLLVGAGRGGTEAYTIAARKPPGQMAGVGSIGGPFDSGASRNEKGQAPGLRGARLFLGIARDTSPVRMASFMRGAEELRKMGFAPVVADWPGSGDTFPKDVPKAVADTLGALGVAPAR
jgi:hypothetical protein